jgi:O-antigen ligase
MVLLLAFAALPWGVEWARARPRAQALLAVLLGFLPFIHVEMHLVSEPSYRGDTRGLALGLVDLVAAVLHFSLPREGRLPDRWPRAAWLLVALASVAQAPRPVFSLYGVANILRLYFLGAVAARGVRRGLGPHVLRGLACGLVYATLLALEQRYLHGVLQASGPFVHRNGLGMVASLVAPTMLALLLAGQGGRLAALTLVCAALAVVLALSRAALVTLPTACALVFLGSWLRRPSTRKLAILATALLALGLLLLKSHDTLVNRFQNAPAISAESRDLFEASAGLMLAEHPWGIGLNQFSWVQSHEGYGERVGLRQIDLSGLVHNIYWLTAAETGWLGLVAYALVLLAPLLRAFGALRRGFRSSSVRADLLLGLAASLAVTYVHGQFEWALRIMPIAQVLWLLFGFIAALAERGHGVSHRESAGVQG